MFADTSRFSCMPNMNDEVSKEPWPNVLEPLPKRKTMKGET